ncbi:DUF1850 domain-containing protein [Sediminibacillus halophilus]|uniref:DUF1850 domain-containing protein n=1 Tax=Sediminibacillus halophilus TaxID=482461 RepID=A0A1G9SXS3_9BACI|nr:DUF1850 domain-containing protein [Sediminibacillus halophilus]SDM40233.1 hypothetical protein SAMN05216244_2361 [Sediminibacillus halophilus]
MPLKKGWLFIVSIFLLAATAVLLFYPYRYILALQDPFTDEILAYLPVNDTDHFQIKFTHSVHLSDVIEEYEINQETIYPYQLIYEDTAIGMPSNAGEGETFEMKDGKYYISNLQGSLSEINLAVGQVRANHKIIYQNQSYLLKDYVGAGTSITITPTHESNWHLLKGVNIHER